ncbi:MAG: PA2169 family four-helix-bundle protein [Ginsengibacter sp.]
MQTITDKTKEALEDLIIINNDRYEGYQKAMEQTKDSDLKALFSTYSTQSKGYASALRTHFPAGEEQPARDETRISGKFYRAWMDVKNALTSDDRQAVLNSCEYGEDVAKKAYENVLEDRENLSDDVLNQVQDQYDELLDAHNTIKGLRDANQN